MFDENSFKLQLSVRDYECDMQGIVNNSVYQNYFEHARHEYLKSKNLSFKQFIDNNIYIVLIRVEIDYKKSLRSGDAFYVTVKSYNPTKLKIVFEQEIYCNDSLMTKAVFTLATLDKYNKIIPSPVL